MKSKFIILGLSLLAVKFTSTLFAQDWTIQQSNTSENLNYVFFIDDTIGWICGDNGVILKTTDSGNNWFSLPSSINKKLNNIHFINDEVGYVSIGESGNNPGSVAKSTNGGQIWSIVSDFQTEVDHVHFQTEFDGWAISSGDLFQTTDGGNNWVSRLDIQYSVYHFVEFVDSIGWVVGYNTYGQSIAIKTTDNGQNWIGKNPNENLHCHTVFFIEPYVWIIADFGAQLFLSSDGGDSWQGIYFWDDIAYDVFFISDHLGYIVGRDGIIAKSTDSGLNWQIFNTNINADLNSLYFLTSGIGWAVGNGGTIVNINDTVFTTSITDALILNDYSLKQNYPNPFNPTTTIKFTIPTSPLNPSPYQGEGNRERLITLKVYDVLGNEIAILVNEEKAPGVYEVEFSVNQDSSPDIASGISSKGGYASGVYFYQLKAGQYVETKKMVLLR